MGVIILVDVINTGSFLPPLTSWVSSAGVNEWLSAGARVLDKALTSRGGCFAVDKGLAITNLAYAKVEGYRNRVLEALAWRARSAWPRARPGSGPSGGAPAWFGAAGEPRSGLIAGEAPGPTVLGGPPQAKAPPAHSPMICAWGVEMSLLCPPGGPTGAHSLIYQANPIGRPARKATADFSKIKILFWVRRARYFLR